MLLRLFLLLLLAAIGLWLFRKIVASKWFNRFCESLFGPHEPDGALASFEEAKKIALEAAEEAESWAENRKHVAEKVRKRIQGNNQ